MTVALAWELPAQPGGVSGIQTWVPLGGDGLTAPLAAYSLRAIRLDGATSGPASIACTLDPRFCSMVSYATAAVGGTLSTDMWIKITVESDSHAVMVKTQEVPLTDSDLGSHQCQLLFQPPPVVLPGGGDGAILRAQFEDQTNAEYYLDAYILLFDIRVRELTPYPFLVAGRGGGAY